MKYFDYKENRQHGTFDFPIAYYHVTPQHPRYNMPYHWHTEYEIIRVLSGDFLMTLDGNSVNVKKGELVFIYDGVLHGGIPEDCVYECIVFDMKALLREHNICSNELQDIINHTNRINSVLQVDHTALKDICNILFDSMAQKKPGHRLITQGSLYHLFGTILELGLYSISKENTSSSQQRLDKFKDVISFIEEMYHSHLTLEELSAVSGMSPKYFCRFFRGITHKSPIDYLNYYRIECSCQKLISSYDSITEIALNCGFNDISYFIKTFKKYKGITPKQYMKLHHK